MPTKLSDGPSVRLISASEKVVSGTPFSVILKCINLLAALGLEIRIFGNAKSVQFMIGQFLHRLIL